MKKLHNTLLQITATASVFLATSAHATAASTTTGWLGPLNNIKNLVTGASDTVMAIVMLVGIIWFVGAIFNIKKLGDEQVPPKTKNAIMAGIPAGLMAIFLYSAIDLSKVSFLGDNAQTSSEVKKTDFGI